MPGSVPICRCVIPHLPAMWNGSRTVAVHANLPSDEQSLASSPLTTLPTTGTFCHYPGCGDHAIAPGLNCGRRPSRGSPHSRLSRTLRPTSGGAPKSDPAGRARSSSRQFRASQLRWSRAHRGGYWAVRSTERRTLRSSRIAPTRSSVTRSCARRFGPMAAVLLITLDTNLVDPDEIASLAQRPVPFPHEFRCVSVTEREHGFMVDYIGAPIFETAVWGKSRWGHSVWGGVVPATFVLDEPSLATDDVAGDSRFDTLADGDNILETVLDIIADGGFPRTDLSRRADEGSTQPAARRDDLRGARPKSSTRSRQQRPSGIRQARATGET